ncbi:hypothetical protein [Methylobacterium terrae]|uniref:hypothetical protein n=1 Tax=Methylobacterium terrae TaxID=2202827 RepID=UPI001ABF8059|nr:hypothetical protein [Methylobacterium terrae]
MADIEVSRVMRCGHRPVIAGEAGPFRLRERGLRSRGHPFRPFDEHSAHVVPNIRRHVPQSRLAEIGRVVVKRAELYECRLQLVSPNRARSPADLAHPASAK